MAGGSVRMRRWMVALATGCAMSGVWAQQPPPENSKLDALLFFQLLVGELQLQNGQAGSAFEVILDAARRTSDPLLFRRAVDIALQSRAGEQALAAVRAWRTVTPMATEAMRYEAQILLALNRVGDAALPLSAWLAASPLLERPGLIGSMPRLLQRSADKQQAAAVLDQVLTPYRDRPETRTAARIALGRAWLAAAQPERALALIQQAHSDDPQAPGPALLALDLMSQSKPAEQVTLSYLGQPNAEIAVRLAYVRSLAQAQRYTEAVAQLELVTRAQPEQPRPWLSLGALRVEMRDSAAAEVALKRYLQLVQANPSAAEAPSEEDNESESDARSEAGAEADLTQARLMLSQAAEQRGDLTEADRWLAQVDSPQRALEVQGRRASLLARQGRVEEGRSLIRKLPESNDEEARAKLLAEAQLLRDIKLWRDASNVLEAANQRFKDDADLLYEHAMVEERLERPAELERLLRRVIELKPDHAHAHNALGYSLAERNLRLPEARELILKALLLSPGDPFITDSLGWVEYRLGNRDEALRLLRQAYSARPDAEIAAHLGEVLWVVGQHDEARRIWAEARQRDGTNDVLKDTLARLKVGM